MPVGAGLQDSPAPLLARFQGELARLGFDAQTQTLGLAVSGGGDSLALMHLAHLAGVKARVATVDHALRAASADEARMVAAAASALGFAHETLLWQGWDGRGNVQDRARRARRDLLADWARAQGLDAVALAHTQGDLAEGFVMRLARGAGVDGLAAMPARFVHDGSAFLRPLMWATRDELRAFLRGIGADWVDDPSNEALRFDRVRARKALPELAKLGIGSQVLADVAQHLRSAREALEATTDDLAQRVLTQTSGIVTIAEAWAKSPAEVQRRLIQRIILWITPADYPPRGAALTEAMARLTQGLPAQLAGCHFLPHQGKTLAFREARRCGAAMNGGAVWDGMWRYIGQAVEKDTQIGPLGAAGLLQWQGWRDLGLPRAALISQPALMRDGQLLATPLQPKLAQNHAFLRSPAAESLFSMRLSH